MNDLQREIIVIPGTIVAGTNCITHRQLRVASYSRVSTDMEEQLTSFHAQKAYYTEKILRNPAWTLAGTYADEGISGACAENRPDFMRMIRHCKKGKIDLIITKSISRFARNTLDSVGYVRKLKAMGVGVLFEKENINTMDENSEVVLTILASLAQEELNSLSLNVKIGKRMAMKAGKVTYQYSSFYGYEKGDDNRPRPIPERATVVIRIFEQYLAGDTSRIIAEELNREQIPYLNGKKWTEPTIRRMLVNEKYCGDVILQKTYIADPISKKVKINNGELPKIFIKNNHEPIIERELFEKVQEEHTRRSSKRKISSATITEKGKYSSMYALSEILICGHCGTPYRRVTWKKGEVRQAVWRCLNRLNHGITYCTESVTVDEESLHKAIMGAILSSYNPNKLIPMALTKELRDAMRKQADNTIDIGQMERKIASLIEQVMEIVQKEKRYESLEEEQADCEKMKSLSDEAKQLQEVVDAYKARHQGEADIETNLAEIQAYLASQPQDILAYNDSLVRQTIHTIKVMDVNRIIIYFKNGAVHEQYMNQKVRPLRKK
ncbi:recombinase family protein [Bengtsoniella intestinalis]|uniref:recombinase family protein n=1 Tax=Bengtsoniella intestinalis TaxID=3073143 RepID=UPI00391F7509